MPFLAGLLAAVVMVPAAPAATPPLIVRLSPVTVAPGGKPKTADLWTQIPFTGRTPRTIHYTIDYTAVAGLVDVEFAGIPAVAILLDAASADASPAPGPCDAAGSVITCTLPVQSFSGVVYAAMLFEVTARSSATAGQSGDISVTARLDDQPAITSAAHVRIGEPVDSPPAGTPRCPPGRAEPCPPSRGSETPARHRSTASRCTSARHSDWSPDGVTPTAVTATGCTARSGRCSSPAAATG